MPRTAASRLRRPARPQGLVVQERDLEVLRMVAELRAVTSDHVKALLFPQVSATVARIRLRKLWEHRLLERHLVPFLVSDATPAPSFAGRPIYRLGRRGVALLAAHDGPRFVALRVRPPSLLTLEHNLVATDFLVAVEAGARSRADVRSVTAQSEGHLRRLAGLGPSRRVVVPDGAVSITRTDGRTETFYLEVVRAGVGGGNDTLRRKMERYVELHHRRAFASAYGHDHVRAVLIATTSDARVQRFLGIAKKLRHGRRLFWFAPYKETTERGGTRSMFRPESIFASIWRDADGGRHALIDSRLGNELNTPPP